jgi:hypothetical protein
MHHQGIREDAVRRSAYRPGTLIQGSEGFAITSINQDGWRGPEFLAPYPGEVRIIAVGDSFTEALQVADGFTYGDQLSSLLERRIGRPVRVLNCGASGGNPAEYLHLARHLTSRYRPDWTIIQVTDSDFADEELFNDDRRFRLVAKRSGYETRRNPIDSHWTGAATRWPVLSSLTGWGVWRVAVRMYKAHNRPTRATTELKGADQGPSAAALEALPWLLGSLKTEYPGAVLLYIPETATETSVSKTERALQAAAVRADMPMINVRDEFETFEHTSRQRVRGFANTIPGQGHLNAWGHAIVAGRLARDFSALLKP